MPDEADIFRLVTKTTVGTSTNRNAVTPEMRAAYEQVLREKEKILADIVKIQEELRKGGIDNEELLKVEKRLDESAAVQGQSNAKKIQPRLSDDLDNLKNPHRVHPVATALLANAMITPTATPIPAPMPTPIPTPATRQVPENEGIFSRPSPPDLDAWTTASPSPQNVRTPAGERSPVPGPAPSPKPMLPPSTPPPPPQKQAEATQTNDPVVPPNLQMHVTYRPKRLQESIETPAPPPPTPAGSKGLEVCYTGRAKEIEQIDDSSDTALLMQRELHLEIAAMHLAIQKRCCLAGGFIFLLLVLLIFY